MPLTFSLRQWLPETYLILSVFYYWSLTTNLINPVAITLLLIMFLLIWSKNKFLGSTIGIVFMVINVFMLFALASELNDFPAANKDFFVMLFVGLLYFGLNITVAFFLLTKWLHYSKSKTDEVPTN